MIQQKNNFNFRRKSLFTGVIIFIFSLFLFNCSTPSKNQETTMSSTPSRGLAAADVVWPAYCPEGFRQKSPGCNELFMGCSPLEYEMTKELRDPRTGQMTTNCSAVPGYVKCHPGCCKVPRSYCIEEIPLRTCKSKSYHGIFGRGGQRVYGDILFPEGSLVYDAFGTKVCRDGQWHKFCPKGQRPCSTGSGCCRNDDGSDGTGVSQ